MQADELQVAWRTQYVTQAVITDLNVLKQSYDITIIGSCNKKLKNLKKIVKYTGFFYNWKFFSNSMRSHWLLWGHVRVTVHCYPRMSTDGRFNEFPASNFPAVQQII